jgi:broad specificity phosphatase PhoE
MSLLLVRHGQASAGSTDYDRLSPRGELQSQRLGHWLADTGHDFDAVVTGSMLRHRQTFAAIATAYAERGLSLPAAETDPGLDEFDHHAVFDGFASGHPEHPSVAASKNGGLQALGAMIHAALSAWSQDSIADVPETWRAFGERVGQAGDRLAERGSQNVLVLTSGGVISRLAQAVLGASDRSAVDLNLSLRNSGLCEFHARPYGLALGSWNALPHLHDSRELWTYY